MGSKCVTGLEPDLTCSVALDWTAVVAAVVDTGVTLQVDY